MYDLEEIKKFAAKGVAPLDLDVHESVLFNTYRYCYKAYKEDPTERTKERLQKFLEPIIALHYRNGRGEEM